MGVVANLLEAVTITRRLASAPTPMLPITDSLNPEGGLNLATSARSSFSNCAKNSSGFFLHSLRRSISFFISHAENTEHRTEKTPRLNRNVSAALKGALPAFCEAKALIPFATITVPPTPHRIPRTPCDATEKGCRSGLTFFVLFIGRHKHFPLHIVNIYFYK